MTIGPGKYDDLCTIVREKADAEVAVVIIMGGIHGHGFSVQMVDQNNLKELPRILEMMAQQLRKDMQ